MGQLPPAPSRVEPSGGCDFGPAAASIAASVARLLGGRARIYYQPAPPAIVCMAATDPLVDVRPAPSADVDIAFSARVVQADRAICTPDVLAERYLALAPATRDLIARDGIGARAAVPIRTRGEVVGTLVLADRTGRRYTDQEMILASAFAEQMALVIESSRLRAELRRQRSEGDALARVASLLGETLDLPTVGWRIAESVLDLLDVHSSAIRLLRPDGTLGAVALGGRATEYAGSGDVVPVGIGLIGRVAIEGRPMWTADIRTDDRFELSQETRDRNAAAGIIAGLAVPLRAGGQVIGVLSVGSSTVRTFTDPEIALLQAFADQAAIAIANAQSQETMAKQAERLRILHEIDLAIITETAPVAIAEAVLWRLRDLLGVPRAIVNLFDWTTRQVEWLAAVGRHRMHLGPGVRYSLDLAGDLDALRRGEPQVIDVHALPPSPEAEALLASGVLVYMVVPMIAGGELIGSVSFGGDRAQFAGEQVGIAQEVATQLAIAITQARLHERVQEQATELEGRVHERTRELEGANRELEAFTHTVSHDLKAPLRGMEGFAQALEEDYGAVLDDTARDYVGRIRGAAARMSRLVDDLLRYSRIEHRPLESGSVALSPLLDELLAELAGELQTRALTVTRDLAVAEVPGEPEGLREALANLISNAVKFSPERGGVVTLRSYIEGNEVVISVADRGVGFDMQYHERIFGIFQRLHRQEEYPGTGVGLAIVRKVVERHGGRAWATSEPGKGSIFFLALPTSK